MRKAGPPREVSRRAGFRGKGGRARQWRDSDKNGEPNLRYKIAC